MYFALSCADHSAATNQYFNQRPHRYMRKTAAFLALIAVTFAGCVQLQVNEVSSDMVGQRFRVLEELLVYGVKIDRRSPDFEYLTLAPKPGIGGPEITDLGSLPTGSIVEISGLVYLGSRPFGYPLYRITVVEPKSGVWVAREVRISRALKLYDGEDSSGRPVLSGRYFAPLTSP